MIAAPQPRPSEARQIPSNRLTSIVSSRSANVAEDNRRKYVFRQRRRPRWLEIQQ